MVVTLRLYEESVSFHVYPRLKQRRRRRQRKRGLKNTFLFFE